MACRRGSLSFLFLVSIASVFAFIALSIPPAHAADTFAPNCVSYCGNGILEPGEECDDGNSNNYDVCNNSCKLRMKKIPLHTCTGEGELYLYHGSNPFQTLNTSFIVNRDHVLIFNKGENITFTAKVNGAPANLSLVKQATTPFLVKIYSISTTPGSTVSIQGQCKSGTKVLGARCIQGYLAQDSASPVYDPATLQVIYDDQKTSGFYLLPDNYSYVFFDKYTINAPGSGNDTRTLNVKIYGPGGLILNRTYNQPAPYPTQGAIVGEFTAVGEGNHSMNVTTQDSIYWIYDGCRAPFCGDGILQLELGENCDDGNNVNGDGCSAQCEKEDDECVPRTIGYWKQPCLGHFQHENQTSLLSYLGYVHGATDLFDSITDFDDICGILNPAEPATMEQRAKQQMLALWFNVASGKILLCTQIELGNISDSDSVEEALEEAESLLAGNQSEKAKTIADTINNAENTGRVITQCECPACGDGKLNHPEQCEPPLNSNNKHCTQTIFDCRGNKTGTRDPFGDCNSTCGCSYDPFEYSCIPGSCGAQCNSDDDCDDQNPHTLDSCLGDCSCRHEKQPYCGDGDVKPPEQCELPGTSNNPFCIQRNTSECFGYKLGFRDNFGNCGQSCGCTEDPFIYICVKGKCGAQCDSNDDCQPYCAGSFRYYNGVCRTCSTCQCAYSYENCDSRDGWYNSTEYRWVPTGECTEKQEVKKEYRNYYCHPSECKYTSSQETWEGTGNTRNKPDNTPCNDSLYCTNPDVCTDGVCGGPSRDCSRFNLSVIATCDYNPDGIHFTWDSGPGFTSVCDEEHDICTNGTQTINHTCSMENCSAECEKDSDCEDSTCCKTFNDYCDGLRLVEYDSDKVLDSTQVSNSTTNTCLDNCTCTGNPVECEPPGTNSYCVPGVCNATCDSSDDCDDNNTNTIDSCLDNCSCQHEYQPFCGNGIVDNPPEECELPGTTDNGNCVQSTEECLNGTFKVAFRDAHGDCDGQCGCVEDPLEYHCVAGECGAACDSSDDCDDNNTNTIDSCLDSCECHHEVYVPFCGNGILDLPDEQCELNGTFNNIYCNQTNGDCQGYKLGTRDPFGNCGQSCGCTYDPFVYICVKGRCGATCSGNSDCQPYCAGSFRYYNGVCRTCSTCQCAYSYENCDSRDGWFMTSDFQWVSTGECTEKKQVKKEYRDYSCAPEACTSAVTKILWENTSQTRNKQDGTACGLPRDCSADHCIGLNWTTFPQDGHDSCSAGVCQAYSCGQTGSHQSEQCQAECQLTDFEITVFTDKPVYSPEETVSISGRVRDSSCEPVTDGDVAIQVSNSTGPVFISQVATNGSGFYSAAFMLPPGIPLGLYNVFAAYDGLSNTTSFTVAAPVEDSDGDGVQDAEDACPDVYGTACNGCPNPCSGCAEMVCGQGQPTCSGDDSLCQPSMCPKDCCGDCGCSEGELADYPESVDNTCSLNGSAGTCTQKKCEAVCRQSDSCRARHVVFSEVMYDAPSPENDKEWIELFNPTGSDVDLSGFIIKDNGGQWAITKGAVIKAGGYMTIARNTTGFYSMYGCYPSLDGLPTSMSNSGDYLVLKNESDIDMVIFENSSAGWDIFANDNRTITRFPAWQDMDLPSDWINNTEPTPWCIKDGDGDGYNNTEDCNDGNPSIHPGAADACNNGVDEDCSGADSVCLTYSSGGGSSGGGGGCSPSWICSDWLECQQDGTQTRACNDTSRCGTSLGKPAEVQNCTYILPVLSMVEGCLAGTRLCAGSDLMECTSEGSMVKIKACDYGCSGGACLDGLGSEDGGVVNAGGAPLTGMFLLQGAWPYLAAVCLVIILLAWALLRGGGGKKKAQAGWEGYKPPRSRSTKKK